MDPSGTWAYFIATKNSPPERQIYRFRLQSRRPATADLGSPGFTCTPSGDAATWLTSSRMSTPRLVTSITSRTGRDARGSGVECRPALDLLEVSREFLTVKAHDGVDLLARIVKPVGFDPAKKYPCGRPSVRRHRFADYSNRYGATQYLQHD